MDFGSNTTTIYDKENEETKILSSGMALKKEKYRISVLNLIYFFDI